MDPEPTYPGFNGEKIVFTPLKMLLLKQLLFSKLAFTGHVTLSENGHVSKIDGTLE